MGTTRTAPKFNGERGVNQNHTEYPRQATAPSAPAVSGARIYTFSADGNTVLEGRTETGGRFRFLRDQLLIGRNNTGSTIAKGRLVRVTGWDATAEVISIALADNTSEGTMHAVGFTNADIPTNTSGRVWQMGVISGVNTAGMTVGAPLYLGASGTYAQARPSTVGHYRQAVGEVLAADSVNGMIHANISPAYAVITADPTVDLRTSLREFDDFISGNTSTGQLGSLGWAFAGGAATHPAAVAGRPGIVRRDTSATSGTYAYTGGRVSSTAGTIFGTDLFDVTWSFRLTQTDANTQVRVGVSADPATNPPASGLYLEKLFADTAWFGVSRNASAETRTTTGSTVTANTWHRVRTRRISGTQVGVTLDGGTEVLFTTNLPNVALQPFCSIANNVATLKSMDIDYADITVTGLSR